MRRANLMGIASALVVLAGLEAATTFHIDDRLARAEEKNLELDPSRNEISVEQIDPVREIEFPTREGAKYRFSRSTDDGGWERVSEPLVQGTGRWTSVQFPDANGAVYRVVEITTRQRPAVRSKERVPEIEGLRLHLDASAEGHLRLDGDRVEEWRSGAGDIVFTPWRNLQPAYVSDAVSGRPALRFDKASLDTTSPEALALTRDIAGLTFFGVGANRDGGVQTYLRFSTGDSTGKIRADFARVHADHRFRGRRLDDDPMQTVVAGARRDEEWSIDTTVLDYAEGRAEILFNGETTGATEQFQTAGKTSATDSRRVRIGSDTRNDPVVFWQGDIAEILVFDRTLSVEERNEVGMYLSEKYEIPFTVTHERTIEHRARPAARVTFQTASGHRYVALAGREAVDWEIVMNDSSDIGSSLDLAQTSLRSVRRTTGELLYNGIRLPREWPPAGRDPASEDPMPVPYLDERPTVIPIDIGRQLFVDDFLIGETNLERRFHRPRDYENNPVLEPETPVELAPTIGSEGDYEAVCYLGHGGVFFDPVERLFKMWYTAGWRGGLAFATSRNGFDWTRPDFGDGRGNLIFPAGGEEAGWDNSVWLDLDAREGERRFKFLTQRPGRSHTLHTSADNLDWGEGVETGMAADYCSFFHNPFRDVWVHSIKRNTMRGRARDYAESPEFLQEGVFDSSVFWVNADRLDSPDPAVGDAPQLYSLNGIAYESLLLGMFYIHLGPNNRVCEEGQFPKMTELHLGFSRDGFHWDRPERSPFIGATREEGTWNRAYLHSTTGVFLVAGDYLYFPYTGFSGEAPTGARGMYTGGSIGMAVLRRDGFASMDAGEDVGTLTTRPVAFLGSHLFVNLVAPAGSLRVEVLDEDGEPLPGFGKEESLPLSIDATLHEVSWNDGVDLSAIAGEPVRFRFHLENGSLYSFWVSEDRSGASGGYVAAGGPGFQGARDVEGKEAYREAQRILDRGTER